MTETTFFLFSVTPKSIVKNCYSLHTHTTCTDYTIRVLVLVLVVVSITLLVEPQHFTHSKKNCILLVPLYIKQRHLYLSIHHTTLHSVYIVFILILLMHFWLDVVCISLPVLVTFAMTIKLNLIWTNLTFDIFLLFSFQINKALIYRRYCTLVPIK